MAKPTLLLEAHLEALRLPTFLREYDKVARHCAQEGLDCPRYLFRVCELDLLDRERASPLSRSIKAAKFPSLDKSLETFEFRAIPSLNKRLVLELARSEYLDRRENVLALGNSCTGITHCALALGLAACQKGYRVRFTIAAALVNELVEARDDKHLPSVQKQLAKQDLLIVDELGYVPLSKTGAELSFEIFSQRYEQAAIAGDLESDVQRMDRHLWLRHLANRCTPRPTHPSRLHPGAERRQLLLSHTATNARHHPAAPAPDAFTRTDAFRHSVQWPARSSFPPPPSSNFAPPLTPYTARRAVNRSRGSPPLRA